MRWCNSFVQPASVLKPTSTCEYTPVLIVNLLSYWRKK